MKEKIMSENYSVCAQKHCLSAELPFTASQLAENEKRKVAYKMQTIPTCRSISS